MKQTDSCKPHFQEQKILTLLSLYIFGMCKFVRKYPNFYTKREDIQNKNTLRHKNRLKKKQKSEKITLDSEVGDIVRFSLL